MSFLALGYLKSFDHDLKRHFMLTLVINRTQLYFLNISEVFSVAG
jgi:hypothetical protein